MFSEAAYQRNILRRLCRSSFRSHRTFEGRPCRACPIVCTIFATFSIAGILDAAAVRTRVPRAYRVRRSPNEGLLPSLPPSLQNARPIHACMHKSGDAQMTSAPLSEFSTPSPLPVSDSRTQPPFPWSDFLTADVICACSVWPPGGLRTQTRLSLPCSAARVIEALFCIKEAAREGSLSVSESSLSAAAISSHPRRSPHGARMDGCTDERMLACSLARSLG